MFTLVADTKPEAPPTPQDAVEAQLAELRARREAAEGRLAVAVADRAAAAETPQAKLEAEKIALAVAERAAKVAEHEIGADRLYREACAKSGDDQVVRVPTPNGSIILRAQTEMEADVESERLDAFFVRAKQAKTPQEAQALREQAEQAARIELTKLVLTPAAHFEATMRVHYRLWGRLTDAKKALSDGRMLAEGKGVAP